MKKRGDESVPSVCSNCRFWERAQTGDDLEIGECKRNPPQTIITEAEASCFYPCTGWNDWCGEFRIRVDA